MIEHLGAILADHVQRATAAGTVFALDIDDHFVARQVCRQRAAIAIGRPCASPSLRWLRCVLGRLAFGGALLRVFQTELQLIEVELLGTGTKSMAQ